MEKFYEINYNIVIVIRGNDMIAKTLALIILALGVNTPHLKQDVKSQPVTPNHQPAQHLVIHQHG